MKCSNGIAQLQALTLRSDFHSTAIDCSSSSSCSICKFSELSLSLIWAELRAELPQSSLRDFDICDPESSNPDSVSLSRRWATCPPASGLSMWFTPLLQSAGLILFCSSFSVMSFLASDKRSALKSTDSEELRLWNAFFNWSSPFPSRRHNEPILWKKWRI